MSKIQTALSKLQGAQVGRPKVDSVGDSSAGFNDTEPGTEDRVGEVTSPYRGAPIQLDFSGLTDNGLMAPERQAQQIANEFKVIKRPLLKNSVSSNPAIPRSNLWMVTSALAGEGKTFTSINLAMSVARERGRSVILVDADCSKAHISKVTGTDDSLGFLDLLKDPELDFNAVVRPTNIQGLFIVPAGKRDEHAPELLSSSVAADLCKKLAEADPSRIILFDSSPLLQTVEAGILAAHIGQVVLVVRANKTPRDAVFEAYQQLDSTIPINLILTHADTRDSIGAYGGYYGQASSE